MTYGKQQQVKQNIQIKFWVIVWICQSDKITKLRLAAAECEGFTHNANILQFAVNDNDSVQDGGCLHVYWWYILKQAQLSLNQALMFVWYCHLYNH